MFETVAVEWGTQSFRAARVAAPDLQQQVNRIGTGVSVDRLSREGPIPFLLSDLSGGLDSTPVIFPIEAGGNKFRVNHGVQTRQRGLATLPNAHTNQSSITSDEDISGAVAAGWFAHAIETSVGTTSKLYYVGLGHILYRTNATTGAWEEAHTFTNVITAVAELVVEGTEVLAVATDGATDDVLYTTDPTADPTITWVTLVALDANDEVFAMDFLATVGPGINVLIGTVGGVNGVWWMDTGMAAPWTLNVLVLSTTADDAPGLSELQFSSNVLAGAGANDATAGDVAWSTPGNITADDGSLATATAIPASAATVETSQYLKASSFDWSADSIPNTAIIEGVLVTLGDVLGSTTGDIVDWEIYLAVSGVQVGVIKRIEPAWTDAATTRYYGSFVDCWLAPLIGSDLANLEVWVRVANQDAINPVDASIDFIQAQVSYRTAGQPRTFVGPRSPSTVEMDLGGTAWTNIFAAMQDDSSHATKLTEATAANLYFGGFFNAGEIPDDAVIEDIVVKVKRSQTAIAIDGVDVHAQLYLNGATIGNDLDYGIEIGANSTSEETHNYFFYPAPTVVTFDHHLTGADLSSLFFGYDATGTTTASQELRLNHVAMYISYRERGETVSFTNGGFMVSANRTEPNRITIIDGDGEMWHIDFAWDTTTQRPVMAISQPNEGMPYVWHATSVKGGYLLTGSTVAEPGRMVKFVDSQGRLLNYRFPQLHGVARTAVNTVFAVGDWALLDVIHYSTGTTVADRQWWWLNLDTGAYYPDFLLQSLSGLRIGLAPVRWGTAIVNHGQDLVYSCFPQGTDTAVARAFCPVDPSSDPRITNTDEVKTAGVWSFADFESGNTEHLTRADEAALEPGDTDFTICGWATIESFVATRSVLSKYTTTGNQRGFLAQITTAGRLAVFVSADGTAQVSASPTTVLSVDTQFFWMMRHSASANTIEAALNAASSGASYASTAHSGGIFDSTANFTIGGRQTGTTEPYDGRQSHVMWFGSALSDAQISALYALGPLDYIWLPEALRPDVHMWNLTEFSAGTGAVTRSDSVGTAHLTDTNTVPSGSAEGPALAIEVVRLSVGPEEANKAFSEMVFQGTDVSATDTVRALVSTDGAATFPIDNTFETSNESYDEPNAGRAYRSLVYRLQLDHTDGSADTPNALPLLTFTSQEWPRLRTFVFEVERPEDLDPSGDVFAWLDNMTTLANTKPTQPLSFANIENVPARMARLQWAHLDLTYQNDRFVDRTGKDAVLVVIFEEARGSGAA